MPSNKQSETESSSPTPKKLPQDELINFVFNNLRNVIICASIVAAVPATRHLQGNLSLCPSCNDFLALILVIFGIGLLTWNLVHGAATILQQFQMNRCVLTLIALPLMGIYMYLMWIIWAGVLSVQLKTLHL